jgi:hypothetical protein
LFVLPKWFLFACRKILQHRASGFISSPKEGMLLSPLKFIASVGFELANVMSSSKHINH